MLRGIAITVLLAATIAASAVAGDEPQFQPGPGLKSLDSGVTGVYELGSVRFGRESGRVQALVHHGRVLQVHCRHGGRWLAKRGGSSGGVAVTPTRFDELASIAGGLNRDVGQASAQIRANFARAAGLVILDTEAASYLRDAGPHSATPSRIQLIATAKASTCGAIGCGVIHRQGAAGAERFVITVDSEGGRWSFEGYGIVAIWPVPQID